MNREDTPDDLQKRLRRLFHYWFVQYNPLYFFSALCVLFGVYLVSRGLEERGWTQGQMLLTAVIQAYEILLIAGVAILFRGARQYRPAVILGMMEVFFLLDCTFQTEAMATFGGVGLVLAAVWVAMVALKLEILMWAFRLTASVAGVMVPVLAAVGLAGTPHLFGGTYMDKTTAHLVATWYGIGLTALVLWKWPRVSCEIRLDGWGRTVIGRATRATWIIWAGFYLYHLIAWSQLFDITLTIAHAAPVILLVSILCTKEAWVWAGGLGAIAFASIDPSTVATTSLAVGIVLSWKAWHTQRHRLYVGAVLALYVASWTIGWRSWPLPDLKWWLNLVTAGVLLLMAWRLRLRVALVPSVLGLLPAVRPLVALGALGWGILLLLIGFVALIMGVTINWIQRQPKPSDPRIGREAAT